MWHAKDLAPDEIRKKKRSALIRQAAIEFRRRGYHATSMGDIAHWQSDAGAPYLATHLVDGAALTPQVAAPHSPANAGPVGDYARVSFEQAYIGACTGAKLEDLQMAARL